MNETFKHPLELGAEALEAEAAKPKNRKYKKALLLSAEHYRKEASRLITAFNDSEVKEPKP